MLLQIKKSLTALFIRATIAELANELLNTESVADATDGATHDETIHVILKDGVYIPQ